MMSPFKMAAMLSPNTSLISKIKASTCATSSGFSSGARLFKTTSGCSTIIVVLPSFVGSSAGSLRAASCASPGSRCVKGERDSASLPVNLRPTLRARRSVAKEASRIIKSLRLSASSLSTKTSPSVRLQLGSGVVFKFTMFLALLESTYIEEFSSSMIRPPFSISGTRPSAFASLMNLATSLTLSARALSFNTKFLEVILGFPFGFLGFLFGSGLGFGLEPGFGSLLEPTDMVSSSSAGLEFTVDVDSATISPSSLVGSTLDSPGSGSDAGSDMAVV
mmetsp:Transcript_103928/g.179055  ORF Transcript_103928/g.179055 Transcript_103928/m.179055 type:complete len:277 (-) Transcript_103928:1012-1842(-)